MPEVIYNDIQTVQQAINMAVAENRVVRFLSTKSNTQLKSEIVDIKNCLLRKKDKDSNDIAVIPPKFHDTFDFDDIDTSVSVSSNLWLPRNLK